MCEIVKLERERTWPQSDQLVAIVVYSPFDLELNNASPSD